MGSDGTEATTMLRQITQLNSFQERELNEDTQAPTDNTWWRPEETRERSIVRHICTDFPDRVGITRVSIALSIKFIVLAVVSLELYFQLFTT
jgi:hypothetical protein